MTDASELPDVTALSYEDARDELRSVVARLEAGGEPLESSLALWERGEALADRCQQWLDGARKRLADAQAKDSNASGQNDAPGSATRANASPDVGSTEE